MLPIRKLVPVRVRRAFLLRKGNLAAAAAVYSSSSTTGRRDTTRWKEVHRTRQRAYLTVRSEGRRLRATAAPDGRQQWETGILRAPAYLSPIFRAILQKRRGTVCHALVFQLDFDGCVVSTFVWAQETAYSETCSLVCNRGVNPCIRRFLS